MKNLSNLLSFNGLQSLFLGTNIIFLMLFVSVINLLNTLSIGLFALFVVFNIIILILKPSLISVKKFKFLDWAEKLNFDNNISLIAVFIVALSITLINFGVFGLALIEEIIFRWMPMLFVVIFANITAKVFKLDQKKIEKIMIISVLIISSLLFGFVHNGLMTICIQGFNGACMFAIYLRPFFKRNRSEKIWKWQIIPLLYSTTFHALYNIISYSMI